ncbi:MAG: CDP-glucose 4,6-dehydratase [Chitinivibrionales bacterium]
MNGLFSGIYKDKRVFLTGHTGFKGSWLSAWLKHIGAEVCGFSLSPATDPNHFTLVNPEMESNIGNLSQREKLKKTIQDFQPDIVFHLAAQPLLRYSYEAPHETYETNVLGTLNLFEAARQCDSVQAMVIITTDKVYENNEWEWGYREIDRLGGYDPYSSSKACAEILCSAYRKSYFNPEEYGEKHNVLIATARAGNVIGGGDWAKDRLIPDIIRSTVSGKKTPIRHPEATRPWQHVLDSLSGYLQLGSSLLSGSMSAAEAFNFGPQENDNLSVDSICRQVKSCWESADFEYPEIPDKPHEAGLLRLDSSKAKSKLGWKPVWESGQAIKKTVEWYRDYYHKNLVNTLSDIESYVTEAQKKGIIWTKKS